MVHTHNQTAKVITIEKLDDVGEVHVIVDDDVSIHFEECQSEEEDEVCSAPTRQVPGRPDSFPHEKHLRVF